MKTARKLTSLLLALLLVFALAATAAADGDTYPGSITVDNPQSETNYTAYKIFDMVYDDATNPQHYSYTIDNTSPWFSAVESYAKGTDSGLFLATVGDATNTTIRVVTVDKSKFSAPSFAAALKKANVTDTGYTLQAENGSKPTARNLPLGYYFVTSDTGALCSLDTTKPDVIIYDKNDMPFEKTAEETDVEVGQEVHYTIKGEVPEHTIFDTYTYMITDTMSTGLTFKKNVQVVINDADVTTGCDITYDVENNANKFTVSIPVKSYEIGAKIEVKYSATVNEQAVAKISKNKATLTYSNNPTDESKTTTTPEHEVPVYTAQIAIEKVEKVAEGTTAKKLKGAEFVLYKEVTTDGGNTKQYYKWNTDEKKVQWVTDKKEATVKTTGENGEAFFDGLANGTYHLVETKAPAGYNQMTEAQEVVVNGDATGANLTVNTKVENQAGTLLPSTGGMGTTVFYVLGAVLVVGAGVLLVTKKRMSRNEG